ncbi:MAG: CoA-binding protein [Candidatus Norongarragalinales archaeon]
MNVAIVGASNDRSKFGNKAVRAYLKKGWRVFPVNPREAQIEGLKAFNSISEMSERPDVVSVYLPPGVVLSVLDGIAKANASLVYFNPGTESAEVVEKARALGIRFVLACSIRAIGENPEDY